MAVQATRRMVLLLVTALVVVAMMTVAVMAATATSAFAQEKSEESCGASNPKIDEPSEKGNKGKEFEDCGFRNNPNEEKGFPPGQNQ
jgi:hypothetical protein